MTKVEAFRIFLDKMPDIRENELSVLTKYQAEFDAHTAHLNPQEASDYAQRQLEEVKADEHLLDLYNAVAEFMEEYIGEGALAEDVPLVEDVTDLALRLSSNTTLSASTMQLTVDAVAQAFAQKLKSDFLSRFLEQNAGEVQEFRLVPQTLERCFAKNNR